MRRNDNLPDAALLASRRRRMEPRRDRNNWRLRATPSEHARMGGTTCLPEYYSVSMSHAKSHLRMPTK